MKFLSAIPLPLRMVAIFLVVVIAYKAFGSLSGSILLPLMILLWVVVITTLMYEFGWLNPLAGVPVISGFLGFMTRRAAIAGADAAANESAGPRGELSDEDRATLYENASSVLRTMTGFTDVEAEIHERFIQVAQANPDNPFATQAPAVFAVFSGPRGVGKTTAARATAQMLAGCKALQTAKIITLRNSDLRSGQYSGATDLGTKKAQEAVGGTLLLDDADWLLQDDPYGGTQAPGVDLGLAILDVARQHERKIVIIATMSAEAAAKFAKHEDHSRWLGKLTRRSVEFTGLDEGNLLEVLQSHLSTAGWSLEDKATASSVKRLMLEQSDRAGESFDNAEACRRTAETLMETAQQEYDPADAALQQRIIKRQIVTIVDEELE